MTTATLNGLPIDDDETAILLEIVKWRLYELEGIADVDRSFPAAKAAELDRASTAFAHQARLLRMIDKRQVVVDETLVSELRSYEAQETELLIDGQTSLREMLAGDDGRIVLGMTFEESIPRHERQIRGCEERLATCRGLLRRCESGDNA